MVKTFKEYLTKDLRVRHAAMMVVAMAFFSMAFLAYINLLEFTVPTEYQFISYAASGEFWLPILALCGVFIVAAMFKDRLYRQAMSAAAGFMFTWSFFNMIWGVSTVDDRAVSLAGPTLGFALSLGSFIMAVAPLPHHEGGK